MADTQEKQDVFSALRKLTQLGEPGRLAGLPLAMRDWDPWMAPAQTLAATGS